jgi:hypothetical protein
MFLLAPAIATTMNLVCPGVWARSGTGFDTEWSPQASQFVTVNVTQQTASEGEVRVELKGTDGRLLITHKKTSKWWPLSEVSLGSGRIQAKMRFNLVDHPNVTIDLSAGRIRIQGRSESFIGVCKAGGSGASL